MTTPPLDDFMLRTAPRPAQPIAPELLAARPSIRAALADLAAIDDGAMEKSWRWRDVDADVRYGFYRQYEAIEDVRALSAPMLADALRAGSSARPLIGAATEARWDLHGLLAGLSDEDIDADPGNGEWSVRRTLGHIVGGQRAYGWYTMWWVVRNAPADDFPPRVPDDVAAEAVLPDEEVEALGTLAEISARLDDIVDLSATLYAPLDEQQLGARARWSGVAVDARFRVNRWSSHLREHTVQIEKTLVMINRDLSEAERLTRLVAAAWGRLEGDLLMLPADQPGVSQALGLAQDVAAGVARDAADVMASAA